MRVFTTTCHTGGCAMTQAPGYRTVCARQRPEMPLGGGPESTRAQLAFEGGIGLTLNGATGAP